jgi:putative transposase
MCLPFREGEAGLPRFWQARFYDFNVYSAKKIREKLEYMHANPVKRGLVENPAEWVWSSYLDYEKGQKGLVPIDFTD